MRVLPEDEVVYPVGHAVHAAAPVDEYDPMAQVVHVEAEAALYEPAAHTVHPAVSGFVTVPE